jgi:hypothetical protein
VLVVEERQLSALQRKLGLHLPLLGDRLVHVRLLGAHRAIRGSAEQSGSHQGERSEDEGGARKGRHRLRTAEGGQQVATE